MRGFGDMSEGASTLSRGIIGFVRIRGKRIDGKRKDTETGQKSGN